MSESFPGFYGNFKFHALFLHLEHMKFPEILEIPYGLYIFPSSRACDIYLTFPLCIKNFMCLVNLGHLTFPEISPNLY